MSHSSLGADPVPQNIQKEIRDIDTQSKPMLDTLDTLTTKMYPGGPSEAKIVWDKVYNAIMDPICQLGIDIEKLPSGSLKATLHPLQSNLRALISAMDDTIWFDSSWYHDGARAAINMWNNGDPKKGLPSGVQILEDLNKLLPS